MTVMRPVIATDGACDENAWRELVVQNVLNWLTVSGYGDLGGERLQLICRLRPDSRFGLKETILRRAYQVSHETSAAIDRYRDHQGVPPSNCAPPH